MKGNFYLVGGTSPVGDFSQTVTLGEWLVRHVLELGRDSVRAPTIFIVLNKKKQKLILTIVPSISSLVYNFPRYNMSVHSGPELDLRKKIAQRCDAYF